jgi:hypothetical protein
MGAVIFERCNPKRTGRGPHTKQKLKYGKELCLLVERRYKQMRTHRELVKDFEQLVEDWFQTKETEVDWDLTTREERIASMFVHYLSVAHPDDYPQRIKGVIGALETQTE